MSSVSDIVRVTVVLIVFCHASSSEGRRMPAATISRDVVVVAPAPEAERSPLTRGGCCNAAALWVSDHPQAHQTTRKPGHYRRMLMATPALTVTQDQSLPATTPAPSGLPQSEVTAEAAAATTTPTGPRGTIDRPVNTVAKLLLDTETSIVKPTVQLLVAVFTAFVTAAVLSGMIFFVVLFASSSSGQSYGQLRRTLTPLPDLEKAERCPKLPEHHVTIYTAVVEPHRDLRSSNFGVPSAWSGPTKAHSLSTADHDDGRAATAAALEEKSRLLRACQGELESLKAKLADAEARLKTSSCETSSLRTTLANTEQELEHAKATKQTSERRLRDKDAQLSRVEFEADIMRLEIQRQEEELLDTQEELSTKSNELSNLSNELMEVSSSDDEETGYAYTS